MSLCCGACFSFSRSRILSIVKGGGRGISELAEVDVIPMKVAVEHVRFRSITDTLTQINDKP